MLYLRLALLLIFAAVVAAALWYRAEAIGASADAARARADLAIAQTVNEQNEKSIAALKLAEIANNQLVIDLLIQIDTANEALADATDALDELKKNDEDVRSYLDTPVPDSLKRLYDH